jgi:hypothetical protein
MAPSDDLATRDASSTTSDTQGTAQGTAQSSQSTAEWCRSESSTKDLAGNSRQGSYIDWHDFFLLFFFRWYRRKSWN